MKEVKGPAIPGAWRFPTEPLGFSTLSLNSGQRSTNRNGKKEKEKEREEEKEKEEEEEEEKEEEKENWGLN